jgi:large subunit ribosomal protein L1
MHVNINPAILTKEKKSLSGSVNLPHGTGKKRIIVIADEALIEQVQKGKIEFDVLVAHPSMMAKLARVARILGPKGLMPNPKNGTVTPTPEKRVTELAGGEINWKTEPDQPVIHQAVGKVSYTPDQLEENIRALVKVIGTGKIAKLTLSSSMGPGIKVATNSL